MTTPNTVDALTEVIGCFEAAFVEGLMDALANTEDARLKDLVERRLMFALPAAQAAVLEASARALAAIPEGFALVPVEPTDEMIDAGCDAADHYRVDMCRAWEAMLAATPTPLTEPCQDVHERLAALKLSMEASAWDGVIQLEDALANIEDAVRDRAALRASSPAGPTINLKGHEFKPSDLLRRGVLNLRKGRSEFFWAVVSKSFGLGSTCSAALAAWAGRDPDTGIVTKEST